MHRAWSLLLLLAGFQDLPAQNRPDLSGIWKLQGSESRMVGAGGRVGPGPQRREIVWIITHRDPAIRVVVNVRDSSASEEFAFECTTDGRPCVNELRQIQEVRRMTATWRGDTLHMRQRVESPRGGFEAEDRLHLAEGGQVLVFNRTLQESVRGERRVLQILRKQQRPPAPAAPASLPSVDLPPSLDRVLRDYERFWGAGDEDSLSLIFTEDGFIYRRGGWIRGRSAIREAYAGVGSDLRLRAVGHAVGDTVGYIIGGYRYGDSAEDTGRFILALRRSWDGLWLIAADLDGSNRP